MWFQNSKYCRMFVRKGSLCFTSGLALVCSQFLATPLRNFTCPPVNLTCNAHLFAISEILYPKQLPDRDLLPPPQLNEVLSSFHNHHCFAMITLFQAADIPQIQLPIILRRPEAIVFGRMMTTRKSGKIFPSSNWCFVKTLELQMIPGIAMNQNFGADRRT